MNFKPTKKKVITTIAIMLIGYLIISFIILLFRPACDCMPCLYEEDKQCKPASSFQILPKTGCDCSCCPQPTPIGSVISQILIVLAPGIITYIIWSFAQKSISK